MGFQVRGFDVFVALLVSFCPLMECLQVYVNFSFGMSVCTTHVYVHSICVILWRLSASAAKRSVLLAMKAAETWLEVAAPAPVVITAAGAAGVGIAAEIGMTGIIVAMAAGAMADAREIVDTEGVAAEIVDMEIAGRYVRHLAALTESVRKTIWLSFCFLFPGDLLSRDMVATVGCTWDDASSKII
jgi:hypothetical protein